METINVLLVEDSPDDAELNIVELEESGFAVQWQRVDNEADYLACLNPDIDVILADYTVPQFNASVALKLLQSLGLNIPFIIITGTISEEVAVECMKQGATDYLLKDRLSRLGEAVRHALVQRRLRQEKLEADRNLRIMDWAINSSINAIAIAGLDGKITYVNGAFLCLWQMGSEQEIIGKSITDLWQEAEEAVDIEHVVTGNMGSVGEMAAILPDETQMTLQYSLSTVIDEQDQPICVMATFVDITAQKEALAAQHEADRLQSALENEKELNDLRSRFTSMLVHDFRNPLASIVIQLNLLLSYLDRYDDQQKRDKISFVLEAAGDLNELLEDVLMVSQMNVGDLAFQPTQMDFVAFCRSAYEEFKTTLGSKHSIAYESHKAKLEVGFDPKLMRRVLLNLVSNAVKYSPEGSTVTIKVGADDHNVSLTIRDEGIGIPEGDQKRLFEVFHRAGNVGNVEGTGLGLAIVKQAVELHGGSVRAESQEGVGTTFFVRLPLDSASTAAGVG